MLQRDILRGKSLSTNTMKAFRFKRSNFLFSVSFVSSEFLLRHWDVNMDCSRTEGGGEGRVAVWLHV